MAVIDASVYISLVNAHEREHASSWAWFEQTMVAEEPMVAPVILLSEVAAALSAPTGAFRPTRPDASHAGHGRASC
jgi:predicted nucleic acid-binding protein